MKIPWKSKNLGSLIDPKIWQQAHALARAFHGEEGLALHIAVSAASRLESACRRQRGRRRYRPRLKRRKVVMDRAQMLQQLVLEESERWERAEEQEEDASKLNEDLWIVRYVKHLVKISLDRNLFHVTVAICRLLYGYSTRESLAVHDRLVIDPLCALDEPYLRARKKLLIHELSIRFGQRLKTRRGPRGEVGFQGRVASRRQTTLVEETLTRLTPWHTRCAFFDTERCLQTVTAEKGARRHGLRCRGSPSADSEMQRIHQLLHPPCLLELTRELGLPRPETRLRLPHFGPTH